MLVHVVSPLAKKLTLQKRDGYLKDAIAKMKKQQKNTAKGSDEYEKLALRIRFLEDQDDHYKKMLKDMSSSTQFNLLETQADVSESLIQNQEAQLQESAEMDAALQKFANLDVMDTSLLDAELSKVKAMVENNETRSVEAE